MRLVAFPLAAALLAAACADAGPTPAASTANLAIPASCARAAAARSAPVALYDALLALPASDRAAEVGAFLAAVADNGGTPLEDPSGRVVFLGRTAGAASGSFSGWDAAAGVPLVPIAGTDLYAGETTIPRGTSFEYKLVAGGTFVEDPFARNVVWDGIDRGFGVRGELNAVGHPGDAPLDRGRLVALGKVHARKLDDDRDVWVHYPAAYDDASCKKLPSIVIHDGLESLTRGGFAQTADALYATRPELAAVLVFVGLPSQDVRLAQYTFASDGAKGDDYVDFLANDLWPRVTHDARTCSRASARGIAGASLGGLISTHAAFEHPEQWGWVGAQSPSYFWADNAMIRRVSDAPKAPLRLYLDSGCPDDNCDVTNAMDALLTAKGYDHVRVTQDGGAHDWPFWRSRLPGLLTHFGAGQTACD